MLEQTGHVVYGGVPIVQSESAIRAKGPRYYCYYADKSVAHASRPAPTPHPHPRRIPAPLPRPPGSSGHCRHLATKGTMVRIPGFRPDLQMQSFEHFPPKHLPPPPPQSPPPRLWILPVRRRQHLAPVALSLAGAALQQWVSKRDCPPPATPASPEVL